MFPADLKKVQELIDKAFEEKSIIDLVPPKRRKDEGGGGGASVSFSGYVYIKGHEVDLSDTTLNPPKAWIKVKLNEGTASYEDGPAPSPFPADEEWFLVANTYGDIHVH